MNVKLGTSCKHTKATLKNLATCLIEHGQIRTTLKKAKSLRSYIEPLITIAKINSLHTMRLLLSRLNNNHEKVARLFQIAQTHMTRPGGYTRIVRHGNNASAYIQIIDCRSKESDKDNS